MMTAARGSRGEELLSMGAESRSKEGGGSAKAGIEMEPPKLGFSPDCAMEMSFCICMDRTEDICPSSHRASPEGLVCLVSYYS